MQSPKRSKVRVAISFLWRSLRGDLRSWLPTRGNVLFTLLVVGSLFWVQNAGALPSWAPAAPNTSSSTISYQGYIADSSGNPVNNSLNMAFRLYNVASGGTALWSETHGAINPSDGLFSGLLGSNSPISQDVFANNSDLWLGITIGSDNEMSPREKIASAPYAMVSNVPDGSITQAKLANNAVTSAKIADGALSSDKLANNTVTSAKIANGAVSSDKLDLAHGKKCVTGTEPLTVNVPDEWGHKTFNEMNLTFTLSANSLVLVWIDGAAWFENVASNAEAAISLSVDNSVKIFEMSYVHPRWFNVNGSRIINLTAGSHTLSVGALASDDGLAKLHYDGGNQTCINYLVLGEQ